MAGTSPAMTLGKFGPDALLFRLIRQAKPREPLLEPGQATAAIKQLMRAAGPRRMRLRVDVEAHGVARLAPGRTRQELGAVGHHDLDRVIAGVNFGFHDFNSFGAAQWRTCKLWRKGCRLYSAALAQIQDLTGALFGASMAVVRTASARHCPARHAANGYPL